MCTISIAQTFLLHRIVRFKGNDEWQFVSRYRVEEPYAPTHRVKSDNKHGINERRKRRCSNSVPFIVTRAESPTNDEKLASNRRRMKSARNLRYYYKGSRITVRKYRTTRTNGHVYRSSGNSLIDNDLRLLAANRKNDNNNTSNNFQAEAMPSFYPLAVVLAFIPF